MIFAAAILAAQLVTANTNELVIARSALRDGLWNLAREHLKGDESDQAKIVVLESYAGENRWDAIRDELKTLADRRGAAFDYYRAVASGEHAAAAKLLKAGGSAEGLWEARMYEAGVLAKGGEVKLAQAIWREVASATNAGERALMTASVNLGEVEALRRAASLVTNPGYRSRIQLRLGRELLASRTTADEGARMIRALVKDNPDSPGAKEAFLALAETALDREAWQTAAENYHEAMEIWPETIKSASVQSGRGWAAFKLGDNETALAAFRRAAELAADDNDRAAALAKAGDVLTTLGRNDEAMREYQQVLSRYPNAPVAVRLRQLVEIRELESRGRRQYREFRFAEAKATFEAVAKADSSRRERMQFFSVLCLYGQGQDQAAGALARQLAATAKETAVKADATLWLAKFDFNRGEWKAANRGFLAFVALMPEHPMVSEAYLWAARSAAAENDFQSAIQLVSQLVERHPDSAVRFPAFIVQGEALIELARFDEALLVLERVAMDETATMTDRTRAQLLRADALFAMGADNPSRYTMALEAYRAVRFGSNVSMSEQLVLSFKIARSLEKLKRLDEAVDQYYTQVVLAYRDGREKGVSYSDDARAAFSRAAFYLADEFERRGRDYQTRRILKLVSSSDVPAAGEAKRRLEALSTKGRFL